mgnify:CR=1 FL=1
MMINLLKVPKLKCSRYRYATSTQYSYSWDMRHFDVEIHLTEGQTIGFYIYDALSGTKFHSETFIEGRLVTKD